jgi:hypothetical protein
VSLLDAPYDEGGSWGRVATERDYPEIEGDVAYNLYVFANCVQIIPYGSYVLMSQKGRYGATVSKLRVSPEHRQQLWTDFYAAGQPSAEESVERREKTGKLRPDGLRESAPKWW